MSNADTIAALYDHERDPELNGADAGSAGGRRRVRQASDWGADDLFSTAEPRTRRPRFEPDHDEAGSRLDGRYAAAHRRARRDGGAETAAGRRRRGPVDDWLQEEERAASAGPWLAGIDLGDDRSDALHDPFAAADDRSDDPRDQPDDVSPSAPTLELDLPLGTPRPARRTVTVTGHPEAVRRTERAIELRHRRPGRSLDERIGHRPDHLAAYAFALGVLLIAIAILTAH